MNKSLILHGYSSVLLCFCLVALCTSAIAETEGLSDFRAALKRLQSTAPISVNAQFKRFGRSGESDELIEREGVVNLRLEDGPSGLSASYSPELIAQMHGEELAKIADENVKTPAINAVGDFQYREWEELLYPAAQLEIMLARYDYVNETIGELDGRPARALTFSMTKDKIDKGFRKYIKHYENQLVVWIDDTGVPIASQIVEQGRGRIFIVIGFKFNSEVNTRYQQYQGRLIAVRREVEDESSGATMQSQRHFIATLSPEASP
ncbi:MAG TPA: hypothetical protein VIC26_04640 [Marinagarivorans sp.]